MCRARCQPATDTHRTAAHHGDRWYNRHISERTRRDHGRGRAAGLSPGLHGAHSPACRCLGCRPLAQVEKSQTVGEGLPGLAWGHCDYLRGVWGPQETWGPRTRRGDRHQPGKHDWSSAKRRRSDPVTAAWGLLLKSI